MMTAILVDATIIDDARSGDEQAFCTLARSVWDRLVGLARGIVGDAAAEDVVQEALAVRKVLKGLPFDLPAQATRAVEATPFAPATDGDGRPIASTLNLSISFRLED